MRKTIIDKYQGREAIIKKIVNKHIDWVADGFRRFDYEILLFNITRDFPFYIDGRIIRGCVLDEIKKRKNMRIKVERYIEIEDDTLKTFFSKVKHLLKRIFRKNV